MRKHKMTWPDTGNKAFMSGKGGKAFELQPFPYPQHARGFFYAAETVLNAYQRQRMRRDELFFPVAYLYRHYLELQFKDIIRVGIDIGFFQQSAVQKILKRHDLMDLWGEVKKLLMDRWPGADPAPLLGVEEVVKEFAQHDPDGQTFRYEASTDGKHHRHAKVGRYVSLANLRKTMDGVFRMLGTCESVFIDYREDLRQSH